MASRMRPRYPSDMDDEERRQLVARDNDIDRQDDFIEVVIWLRDRKGIHVNLEGQGHLAEAADLFEVVKEHRDLSDESDNAFSIWLVSPLLELRLKSNHRPYHFAQLWDDFCSLYTDAPPEDIARDEPVVMFQRNVFLSINDERQINDRSIWALLYHEAKFNVIEGRYVLTPQEYDFLAGIQALIEMKLYNPETNTSEKYKSDLHKFYPPHIYKPKKGIIQSLRSKNDVPCEERLREAHSRITDEYKGTDLNSYMKDLYRKYVGVCWGYPYYGAAFFEAVLQKRTGKVRTVTNNLLHFGQPEIEVLVAINTDGVCLIDQQEKTVILAVPYTELSWHLDLNEDDLDRLPTILLQFLYKEEGQDPITKVLHVFSRQAKLMDALIDSCVKRKLQEGDGHGAGRHRNEDFCAKVTNKMDRLCLSSYTVEGDPITE